MTNSLSFDSLFRSDPETGARILKNPADLQSLFERIPGIDFDAEVPSDDAPKNSQADIKTALNANHRGSKGPQKLRREVIFTCQIGVSACQTNLALQYAMYNYTRQLKTSNLESKTLPKDYKLSVYDGSFEEYQARMKKSE